MLVATNTDATYPGECRELPGAGTMVAAIETCSGKKGVVLGKPERILFELIQNGTHAEHESSAGARNAVLLNPST